MNRRLRNTLLSVVLAAMVTHAAAQMPRFDLKPIERPADGAAILLLSRESGGFAVARGVADHVIAAFVVKYRLNSAPADGGAFMALAGGTMAAVSNVDELPELTAPYVADDALLALRRVRAGAVGWGSFPRASA